MLSSGLSQPLRPPLSSYQPSRVLWNTTQQLGLARSWIYSKTKLNILQVDIFYPKMFVRYVFYVSFITDIEWGPLDPMNHAQE